MSQHTLNEKKSKVQRQREIAIELMEKHFQATGLNLYFRNAIYHVIKEDIEHAMRSLEDNGVITRVNVKGAIAYRLNHKEAN